MSPSETREFWQEVLRLREVSGQTVKSFCESEGIPEHRYYYWRKRLLESESSSSNPGFAAVSFSDETSGSEIVVRVDRFQVEVKPGFDPAVLGSILETVAGVRC